MFGLAEGPFHALRAIFVRFCVNKSALSPPQAKKALPFWPWRPPAAASGARPGRAERTSGEGNFSPQGKKIPHPLHAAKRPRRGLLAASNRPGGLRPPGLHLLASASPFGAGMPLRGIVAFGHPAFGRPLRGNNTTHFYFLIFRNGGQKLTNSLKNRPNECFFFKNREISQVFQCFQLNFKKDLNKYGEI